MFTARVYSEVCKIPRGRVSTYNVIAARLGCRAYRAVGSALKKNPHAPRVPCHRVVRSCGSLGGYRGEMHSAKKTELLAAEGISVVDQHVVDFGSVIWE